MGVLIKNANITVYRHYYDNNMLDCYERINLDGVNVNSKRNATVTDKGVNVAYTTMIVVDGINHKFTTGDKVVLDHIEVDISKLRELNTYNPVTILGVQPNRFLNSTTIECK